MQQQEQNAPSLRFSEFEDKWQQRILSDVSTKITDGTHDTPRPTEDGVPYITAIHVKDGFIDFDNCYFLPEKEHKEIYRRCNPEKGDLLMVNIGASTGSAALVEVEYEFGMKNVALVKPNKDMVDPMFFSQVQRKKSARLRHQLTSGGAQPFLSLKQIGKLKIVIPLLEEQRKIAAFLGAVDEKIAQLQKKKELLEDYKKGCMQKLFSQTLRFTDDNGTPFPDWEEKKLEQVALIIMGTSPASQYYNDNSVGLPLLQGNADIKHRKSSPRIFTAEVTKECLPDDVLLSVRAPVGEVSRSIHHACIGRGMSAIRAKPDSLQEFIYQYLLWFEPRWKSISQGSTFESVNTSDIKSLGIPTPSYDEQKKIADFLSAIDDKIALVVEELNKAKAFKKGLLQQMFV